jgi:hypothetical protein
MRRILRVGVLAASLIGVMGTLAPTPADATTEGSVTFRGVATVHSHGIAYPLVGSNTGDIDLSKTPPNFSNSASVTFTSTTCAAAVANVNKAGKLPAEAGTCVVGAAGSVHGYCGLSDGHVSGTISHAVVGSGTQVYSFHLSWFSAATVLNVSGHWHKHGTTHSGVLKGVVSAVPDPTAGSCTNKLQKQFIIAGEIAMASTTSGTPTSLPPKPSYKSPPTCSPPC